MHILLRGDCMRINWKLLGICVAIPLAVGGISALLTGSAMSDFESMNQPPLSPPGWLFPVVWTVLYIMMGVASYIVLTSKSGGIKIRNALVLYSVQLFFNFMWSIFFFGFGLYWFSFVWLALLWVLIGATAYLFLQISKTAGALMLPYLLWVTFAGYLNFGVAFLN